MVIKLREFIKTSPGFQYSINVKYDLHNETKVSNYIPLKHSLEIIKDIVEANNRAEGQRAWLISGSYGTGKSHLSTVLLSILAKVHPNENYQELLKKIANISEKVKIQIQGELESDPVLPVIINGEVKEFEQALLAGLVSALEEASIQSLMPSTVFSAAEAQISMWQESYPDALNSLENYLASNSMNLDDLVTGLACFNDQSYNCFAEAYKVITHGANFQPLLRGKVEDVYLETARQLKNKGYKGIIVLFDEFGKYLENQWDTYRRLDLKSVQDFAEACNSSGDNLLQLILVTHKPIAQYAARHGQDMVNEWKKVEGRFKSIEMINQPAKVYEIISQVILKEQKEWVEFKAKHEQQFSALHEKIADTRLFSDINKKEYDSYIINGAYPLHPIAVFCLPRFSQKVAQNERTIFTFLAGKEFNSLNQFLENHDNENFDVLTIDWLYDYFENQMKSLDHQDNVYQEWLQTNKALSRLDENESDEARVLKALAIIRALGLFAVMPPNQENLMLAFYGSKLDQASFVRALQNLLNKKILFEGASTGNLEIIEASELDVETEINDLIIKRKSQFEAGSFLNKNLPLGSVLAKRYNDDFAMTRYFSCYYTSAQEAMKRSVELLREDSYKDGVINYIFPVDSYERQNLIEFVKTNSSPEMQRIVYLISKIDKLGVQKELEQYLRRLDGLKALLQRVEESNSSHGDRSEILLWIKETEDRVSRLLREIFAFNNVEVFVNGECKPISSRSDLSRLVSGICTEVFSKTPVFNNEMINKHVLTTPLIRAREKVVDGLLQAFLKPQLGLTGTGPDMAIFRTMLAAKKLVVDDGETVKVSDIKELEDEGLVECLQRLQELLSEMKKDPVSFAEVIQLLTRPPFGIRMGIIPILIGLLFHVRRNEIFLVDQNQSEVVVSGKTIDEALKEPESFLIMTERWSEEKAEFCKGILNVFYEFEDDGLGLMGPTKRVVDAMRRWFVSIPRYTRDSKLVSKEAKTFRRLVKQDIASVKLLFEELPGIFGEEELKADNIVTMVNKLKGIKAELDGYLLATMDELEKDLCSKVPGATSNNSLLGTLKVWYDSLDRVQKERLYSDGTQELIDTVEGFNDEHSLQFLKRVLICCSGLRPEDWNDETVSKVVPVFEDMLFEVENLKETLSEAGEGSEVVLTIKNGDGGTETKNFPFIPVSDTGKILENLLRGYVEEFGDAITNNEKRQILVNLLKGLTVKSGSKEVRRQ